MQGTKITVTATVAAAADKVWTHWTHPQHITQWNFASPDWHCPAAENEVRPGGKFKWTMAARDGSMSFDFEGEYKEIIPLKKITYVIADGRHVTVEFVSVGAHTQVTETFEAEGMNPEEMQQAGWQSILDNFKNYVESR